MSNKSLNDIPLNLNGLGNLTGVNTLTGRRFSQEAIEENAKEYETTLEDVKETLKEDIQTTNPLDEEEANAIKKMFNKAKKKVESNTKKEEEITKEKLAETIREYNDNIEALNNEDTLENGNETQEKINYIKKTMIFNARHLDIIDGIASINEMEKKQVLNQLLEKAISELDPKLIEKALKEVRKINKTTTNKSIF